MYLARATRILGFFVIIAGIFFLAVSGGSGDNAYIGYIGFMAVIVALIAAAFQVIGFVHGFLHGLEREGWKAMWASLVGFVLLIALAWFCDDFTAEVVPDYQRVFIGVFGGQ